jgi:hypothetical protein
MKAVKTKSVTTMKTNLKSTPYFSAYPLKAIKNLSSAEQNNSTPKKIISRLRVMPMVNPYPEKIMGIKKLKTDNDQPTDINWYNSYE